MQLWGAGIDKYRADCGVSERYGKQTESEHMATRYIQKDESCSCRVQALTSTVARWRDMHEDTCESYSPCDNVLPGCGPLRANQCGIVPQSRLAQVIILFHFVSFSCQVVAGEPAFTAESIHGCSQRIHFLNQVLPQANF